MPGPPRVTNAPYLNSATRVTPWTLYVRTTITKDAMKVDFPVLDYVSTEGSPVSTKATFHIQDTVPGLVQSA